MYGISSHWKTTILAVIFILAAIPAGFGEQQIPKLDDNLKGKLGNASLLDKYFKFSITLTDQSQYRVAYQIESAYQEEMSVYRRIIRDIVESHRAEMMVKLNLSENNLTREEWKIIEFNYTGEELAEMESHSRAIESLAKEMRAAILNDRRYKKILSDTQGPLIEEIRTKYAGRNNLYTGGCGTK